MGRVKVGEEEDQALRPDLAGAPCFQLGPRATDHTPRGTSHFPTGLRRAEASTVQEAWSKGWETEGRWANRTR